MIIRSYTPMPFSKPNPLPPYATNIRQYELTAVVQGGYTITLAKLSIGDSMSAGNPLTHALFESFTDHGERMSVARTRVSGHEREFIAVKNAMIEAGVEFAPITPCASEALINGLGEWFKVSNPEIWKCSLVSQS